MQEEQVDQAEATDEPAADAADSGIADSVDEQAAASSGADAEAAPEVPDDASSTIKRAQEHIDNLDMDEEREAAKRTI
jgi:hypothetical protein